MSGWLRALAMLAPLGAMLCACLETRYQPYADQADTELGLGREVYFELTDAFYARPPRCVLILPPSEAAPPAIGELVERALARHLFEKVPRVVDGRARRALARAQALDPARADHRRRLARAAACDTLLVWHLTVARTDHLLVWSRRQIGVDAALVRPGDGALLWHARHRASRSEGGLPLSLLSLPVSAAEATWFYADGDQIPSEIDDVVRRIFVTLPDTR